MIRPRKLPCGTQGTGKRESLDGLNHATSAIEPGEQLLVRDLYGPVRDGRSYTIIIASGEAGIIAILEGVCTQCHGDKSQRHGV